MQRDYAMGFGLQCWDENGNLVVDTSDYNCRYIGTYSVKMNGSDSSATQGVSGISSGNSFAVVVAGSWGSGFNEVYCVTSDNAFTLFSASGNHTEQTFTVEVYRYA